ncbi:MAG: hypothetical protein L6R41_002045 [Letrouitia leprolyta]|nr:MAG: hypothetical protein L6R41_002045 [Letrouitia leprolyta]
MGLTHGIMLQMVRLESFILYPTTADGYFNTSTTQNLADILSSGTKSSTLSGAFDIQFRSWAVDIETYRISGIPMVDRGLPYSIGAYRPLNSVLLHNTTEALEGVLVDTVNGGVGYRNHTLPQNLPLGGQ